MKRVLLVEDNPLTIEMFTAFLNNLDCEVFSATTSSKAMEIFKSHNDWSLIILDSAVIDGHTRDLAEDICRASSCPIICCAADIISAFWFKRKQFETFSKTEISEIDACLDRIEQLFKA